MKMIAIAPSGIWASRSVISSALSERLPVGVADAEAFGGLVDLPRRREAAFSVDHWFDLS